MASELRDNLSGEGIVSKVWLFTAALLLFLIPALASALEPSTLPNPSGLGSQRSAPSLIPKRPEGPDNQGNTSIQASHYVGVDSQGNTSVLTPNNSGGYHGVDSQGHPVTITPLRRNLGVDSQGNIWTITAR
jgi:hypothetical protein